jgi:hypothetical protein
MADLQASIDRVNAKYKELKMTRIVFLNEIPKAVTKTHVAAKAVVLTCKAINLNGTPCKLRAKLGPFCMKHCT